MITKERQAAILRKLKEKEFVEVNELSEAFGVSAETIRRDLAVLEDLGRLTRVRGGAALREDYEEEPAKTAAVPAPPPRPQEAPKNVSAETPDCAWFSPARPPFRICGFPFFERDGVYRRLPLNPPEPLPTAVESCCRQTSGGQVHFHANTSKVYIRVKLARPVDPSFNAMPAAAAGFDLYASDGDGRYTLIAVPRFDPLLDGYEVRMFQTAKKKDLDFILNFPIGARVESLLIGLDRDSVPLPPPALKTEGRIVIYGGSIMHGYSASRPGMILANILSRRFGREVINFGFNGIAKCEREVALAVRMVENADVLIISPEGNCPTVEWLREHMTEFISVYRETHPDTKIAVMSYMRDERERFLDEPRETRLAKKQCEIEIVEGFRARGDRNIVFWDGEQFTGEGEDIFFGEWSAGAEGTSDGLHKSDIGYWLMANGVTRRLKRDFGF